METVGLIDVDGRHIEAELLIREEGRQLLRLQSGEKVWVPDDVLLKRADGDYRLDVSFEDLEEADSTRIGVTAEVEQVVPLAEEEATIQKQRRETSRVRITKRVTERKEHLEDVLVGSRVDVTRVPVHREVEATAPVRQEGDTTIIPLYEEVLVIEKRLMLTEEVHVVVEQTKTRAEKAVTLRREELVTERSESGETDRDA